MIWRRRQTRCRTEHGGPISASAIGIGAWDLSSTSPATPPGMRVRTGRFDGLRLAGKAGNPQLVEGAAWQCDVEPFGGAVPPSAGIGSRLSGVMVRHSASHHFAVDNRTTLPELELYCPQPMTNPTIEVGEHAWCLCELEVSLPTLQVYPERFAHLRDASSGTAPGH